MLDPNPRLRMGNGSKPPQETSELYLSNVTFGRGTGINTSVVTRPRKVSHVDAADQKETYLGGRAWLLGARTRFQIPVRVTQIKTLVSCANT